jgi:hypothetical protein
MSEVVRSCALLCLGTILALTLLLICVAFIALPRLKTCKAGVEYPEMAYLKALHRAIARRIPDLDMDNELPEQLFAVRHIRADDCVLELGGNRGRCSLTLASLLRSAKDQLVVVEIDPASCQQLSHARDLCGWKFSILCGAIAAGRLAFQEWHSRKVGPHEELAAEWTEAHAIPWSRVRDQLSRPFTALVADCEGCLPTILEETPEILDTIQTILIEHDHNDAKQAESFEQVVRSRGFEMIDAFLKTDPLGPGGTWGVSGDPVFVSAWRRLLPEPSEQSL